MGAIEDVQAGQEALRLGDAVAARVAFEHALSAGPSGAALEGLARVAYLEFDFSAAVEQWERAYAAHREADDRVGAIRVARTLAGVYGQVVGDAAVMNGWLARAQTLLADVPDTPERGWVSLNLGMFEGDRDRRNAYLREAIELARSLGDVPLELIAMAYLGASLVHGDHVEEGMLFLDEALAGVAGGEVDDFSALEEIFCQLFSACERAHDVARAEQWMRVGDAIAQRRRLPAVSAFCRTHYGGVMTAAGRWPEADAALTEACRLWALGERSGLRVGALIRLADLRVRQGRFEEAAQLLDGLDLHDDLDAARPLAAIHLAQGETSLARHRLERALVRIGPADTAAAPLLALLVDVALTDGDIERATAAADELAACAGQHPSHHYPRAAAALARGQVCIATGTGDPQTCIGEALAGFAVARLPMELATARLALAHALAATEPEVAIAEARTALDGFERLQAARQADAAAALLRRLGTRPATGRRAGPDADRVLTRREAEVLHLLGGGMSNPGIADRLFISRKTVEHHVSNILAKLGLRSRAEAAAFAARSSGGKPAAE